MRYMILTLVLIFASSIVIAELDPVQQKLHRATHSSDLCKEKLEGLSDKVEKYDTQFTKSRKETDKIKRDHFRAELDDWIDYCAPPEDE